VATTRESWADYVRRVTAGLPRKAIAQAADMNVSGVSRWLTGATRPSPEKVISFARGLQQSPLEALIAAGYIRENEVAGAVTVVVAPSDIPDEVLIDELAGRLHTRGRRRAVVGGDESKPAWVWQKRPTEGDEGLGDWVPSQM
jgi:transcriptional regulator with XRE-family HTH domain